MFVLRQINSITLEGAQTEPYYSQDWRQQVVDANPRYLLQLAGAGRVSADRMQLAASGSYSVPLPQKYTTTNNLHVCLTSDQTIQVDTTGGVGSGTFMVRAGTNQYGVAVFCGPVTGITVTNPQATAANIQWLLFELPDLTSNSGWRDGQLATGVLG